MNVLLDTHALLWFALGDPQLSATARAAIEQPANAKFVSPASYWELAIKISIGKYVLHEDYATFLQKAIAVNGFAVLPIEVRHTAALIGLPLHTRDPFDRLLAAQAIVEQMPLVSCDASLDVYGITRTW